ncbi:MAG: sulfatase [Clostridium sp.]|uniref:sulfatase family protein n=1 Tax=Clostridium sp. TaxID=1506 RepID=UPI00290E9992|nr:sulfatase [Clostridium sp.]MDU4937687.1 sulfatase [Clostridium sp.]
MKPNILFMISHDSGRKFSSYGYKVETPWIKELAENGIQFDNYFCPAPQCSPSRGSIMTGLYPHNNGLMGLAHLGFCIDGKNTTLPKELKKNGYETTLIGLSHETINEAPPIEDRVFSSTYDLGYDNFVPIKGDRAPKVADEVIKFLEEHKENNEVPFYLNVGFFETHRDFDEYEPYADNIEDVEVFKFLPDTKNIRKDVALYNGSAKILDRAIGKIYNKLKETKLDKSTIVIFTTDHGVAFPGAKGMLKEAGLETALIILLPNNTKKNIKKKALLCNVDLLPTILELIDADIPENIDGKSFAELLTSDKDTGRESFFTEMTWHDQYRPMRGIRTNDFSYVKNFEDGPKVYITVDAHLSLSGKEVRDEFYVPNEPEELYDLRVDPLEENNLINNEEYKDIAEELRRKVENWMIETNDPLLKGPISGVGSSRWAKEISEGRAYPGREVYYSKKA